MTERPSSPEPTASSPNAKSVEATPVEATPVEATLVDAPLKEAAPVEAAPMDAVPGNLVDRAPSFLQPYLRLMRADRPIGTWLLLIPCLWGASLALVTGGSSLLTFGYHAALFAIGAFVMRGAGCAYNDIVDRDIDAQVERTALRPLPAGQISLWQAWAFLIVLCLIGLGVLIQFNQYTIILGIGSLALVAAYPFMKRITWWPQAWLGLTFNWGVLVGYAAATGGLSAAAILLYVAGVFWTLGYDTIYAHQDREDDALIGVRSSARALGAHSAMGVAVFYALTVSCFVVAGLISGFGSGFYLVLLAGGYHLFRQVARLDIDDGAQCLALFKSNRDAGLILLAALLLASLF
ncbi:MAG: 4-hydroxybenzoate octaprenyltransferase [Pseudomonadota bacterium]